MSAYVCPQCGESTDELHEGYCRYCCEETQRRLDAHNSEYQRWQSMTGEQRTVAIRAAAVKP